jgi:probable rRNA maturation factor
VVHVTTRGGPFAGVSAAAVRRRALKMVRHLLEDARAGSRHAPVELSIALVDDGTIRDLNRSYRRKDRPTDVLAFPLEESAAPRAPSGLLGDVVVSVPTARRQARARRRPLLHELTLLLAHGLLHLCGYDHATDAEERVMSARTDELRRVAEARRPSGTVRASGRRPRSTRPRSRQP